MQNKLNQNKAINDALCEKIELANSCGVRLVYCQDCQVVELAIGAISVRLCPDVMQRIANVMMKASLQLEHIMAVNDAKKHNLSQDVRPQITH